MFEDDAVSFSLDLNLPWPAAMLMKIRETCVSFVASRKDSSIFVSYLFGQV
jgi:hypothetical protein